jgi:uncharacterized protein YoxC
LIKHINKENLLINDLNRKVNSLEVKFSFIKEENKSLNKNNTNLKSILVTVLNKITDYENLKEDQSKIQVKLIFK